MCFYLKIYGLNALKIRGKIHHCTHAEQVLLFRAGTLLAKLFTSTLAVAKYQLA